MIRGYWYWLKDVLTDEVIGPVATDKWLGDIDWVAKYNGKLYKVVDYTEEDFGLMDTMGD